MIDRSIQPRRRIVVLPFLEFGGPPGVPSVSFSFDANSVIHHVSSTVQIASSAGGVAVVAGGVNLQGPPQVSAPFSKIEDAIHYYNFSNYPGAVDPIDNVFQDRTDFDSNFVKAGSVFNVWVNKGGGGNTWVRGSFILHLSTTSEWVNFQETPRRL